MAFNFGVQGNGPTGTGNVQNGPDLENIQTEALGFQALNREVKLQLLSTPWPTNNLPPPTSSLMSIASRQGLIAAAGPDAVVVASLKSVRTAFTAPNGGNANVQAFQPELKLPMTMRISQLAFTADESYLVLSAEEGGGLAVYDVNALLQGSTQPAFELSTESRPLRALVPNPTPEKAELLAIVTTAGNLLMVNLKARDFVQGPAGKLLKDGVSCASWSPKGKQLVAGLGDGTAYQMTPEGVGKDNIPKPPTLGNEFSVTSLTWLETNIFLLIHSPNTPSFESAPTSVFHLVTRQAPNFMFQKLGDPASPFGLNRSPPNHFTARLRDFPPNLQDMVIIASTASSDIGLFTRSRAPLTTQRLAESITGIFTMTDIENESRRAQLPMASGLGDTSPIGLALDLSSTDIVGRPIPGSEIDESKTPLPALMVLNNEGVLAAWWVVYDDSIRSGIAYPGLVVTGGNIQAMQAAPVPAMNTAPAFAAAPQFGASAFGIVPGLGRPSVWGSSSGAASAQSNTPAFGTTSFPGQSSVPTFGTPTAPTHSSRSSPWGSANTTLASGALSQSSTFGKPSLPFGSRPSAGDTASQGGFSKFASQGGFAAATHNSSGSIFGGGAQDAPSSFSQPNTGSVFAGTTPTELFGSNADNHQSRPFGSGGFQLNSSFKADKSVQDKQPDDSSNGKSFLMGGNFGKSLLSAATPVSDGADMDTAEDVPKFNETATLASTTPTTTPAPQSTTATIAPSNAFSATFTPTKSLNKPPSPAMFDLGKSSSISEAQAKTLTSTPTSTPRPPVISNTPTPFGVKDEPAQDEHSTKVDRSLLEAPLPPDPTSRARFGDSTNSSASTDAPLPPDFVPKPSETVVYTPRKVPSKAMEKGNISRYVGDIPPLDVPALPEDDLNLPELGTENDVEHESEGSGEDVAEESSPPSTSLTPGFTPQTSSTVGPGLSTNSGSFTKIENRQSPPKRSLFGEIGTFAPILSPPKLQFSPGSPSPVRSVIPQRLARPEQSRSISAPGVASQLLDSHKVSSRSMNPTQSTFTASRKEKEEEQRRAQAAAKREAEETRFLLDEDDENMQHWLSKEPIPSTTLDDFVALADYVGPESDTSIPAQVETIFRDINSMIDTLGVNAKSLKGFMIGHKGNNEHHRTVEDLEKDDWLLGESEKLCDIIEGEMTHELEQRRLTDVEGNLDIGNDLLKDIGRQWAKQHEVNKILCALQDPNQLEAALSQPLSSEQASQQHDLRIKIAKFQKRLTEAEEGLTALKAKLISHNSTRAGRNSTGPTVEVVMRTISKITTMAEQRSGNIDVLERQMRKLRFSSSGADTRSRESSPHTTPQDKSLTMRESTASNRHSRFFTPEHNKENARSLRDSMLSSRGSTSRTTPRKNITIEEQHLARAKMAKKADAASKLKAALIKHGARVRPMDDADDF